MANCEYHHCPDFVDRDVLKHHLAQQHVTSKHRCKRAHHPTVVEQGLIRSPPPESTDSNNAPEPSLSSVELRCDSPNSASILCSWRDIPRTPVATLHVEEAKVFGDTTTTRNIPSNLFKLNQETTTPGRLDPSIRDASSCHPSPCILVTTRDIRHPFWRLRPRPEWKVWQIGNF